VRRFLQRISSRKFLTTVAVQIASVAALFWPQYESTLTAAAVRIAALLTLLLAALGYGKIEAGLDGSPCPTERDDLRPEQ